MIPYKNFYLLLINEALCKTYVNYMLKIEFLSGGFEIGTKTWINYKKK